MAQTPHVGITLLEQSQAQKEITVNEAFARIDALLNSGVIDRDLAAPPSSPAAGDVYIVAASPTGAWSGKAGQIAYFDQVWRFVVPRTGILLWVNDESKHVVYNGSIWQILATSGSGGIQPLMCDGRLTLSSGVPVPTTNVTAATTLYFTPYRGNRIALYDGSQWQAIAFTEASLAVPATTNTLYDVWAYLSSGSVVLETTAWTNDTTRATALTLQDNVYVKSGATTRRYLGTIRTGAVSGQSEDSQTNRLVWNYYNRTQRVMRIQDATATWAYSTNAWRQANDNTANQGNFVIGVAEDVVNANLQVSLSNSSASVRSIYIGIGLDSVSSNAAAALASATQSPASTARFTINTQFSAVVAVGYHYLSWIERGAGSDTQTWLGSQYSGFFITVQG